MSDKYWQDHYSNPINDTTEIEWCERCNSEEIEEDTLCITCINEIVEEESNTDEDLISETT